MMFLLPLIAHFLGDFIFQSSKMARRKRSSTKYFITHSLIYSGFIILSLIWFKPFTNALFAALIIISSHALIDYIRNVIAGKPPRRGEDRKTFEFVLFVSDQVLHILIIICSIHLLKGVNNMGSAVLNVLLAHVPSKYLFNSAVLALLYILCMSPAAVFIKKVFILFSLQSGEEPGTKEEIIRSGYLIGVLERIIILTLGLNGQLGAIGFVIAAKSLARFNQLNDRAFAEKYLVGTLLSAAIALFCIVMGNLILIR